MLEPAEQNSELAFEGFYVRGKFEVVAKINNADRAREAWKAFEPE